MKRIAILVLLAAALPPAAAHAAACDEFLQRSSRLTGAYIASGQAYSRAFVFAMRIQCKGTTEIVTVQRPTGNLPVCDAQHDVEVEGTLRWNKALVDGHYEIVNPSSVRCVAKSTVTASAPTTPTAAPPVATPAPTPPVPAPPAPIAQAPSPAPVPQAAAEPPRGDARATPTTVWVGRFQDSRGSGALTFTLVRGSSTVSGTWRSRIGGSGPVSGFVEPGGTRMLLRMDNVSKECPATFEGDAELTDTTLVATYHGKDCDGPITDGRMELRVQ